MLQIKNLHTYYGAIHALKGIDMEVKEGEVVSLIGSNGAGKTTLLNSIMGICKASKGNISFKDKDITVLKGEEKDQVVIRDYITPVNAMEQLYMTVVIS